MSRSEGMDAETETTTYFNALTGEFHQIFTREAPR